MLDPNEKLRTCHDCGEIKPINHYNIQRVTYVRKRDGVVMHYASRNKRCGQCQYTFALTRDALKGKVRSKKREHAEH